MLSKLLLPRAFPLTVADMSTIGFFYLCHPDEHTLSSEQGCSVPFLLCDVVFYQGSRHLQPNADYNLLHSTTFTLLTYSDQKNAVSSETFGHGHTHHAFIGPVKALAPCAKHLRCLHAPPDMPLHTVYTPGWVVRNVSSSDITKSLCHSAASLFHLTGIHPHEILACSLCPGSAMALSLHPC